VKVTRREHLAATPDEVYAVLIDPAFQQAKCDATTNGGVHTVEVTPAAVGARIRTERELPSQGLPDVARSFVGDHLVIVESQEWAAPGSDGVHESSIDMHVRGAPLTLKGAVRLEPNDTGTVHSIDTVLRAQVPLIGGRIERAAAHPINVAIDIEIRLLREWLAR
jgi:hypothetical protein